MLRRTLALALALGLAAPAAAHHGWSGYDSSSLVTLDGQITAVSYGSPHVLIGLQTEEKAWGEIFLAPPSRMQRRGLPEGALKVGENVALEGYPHRSDPDEFRAERIRVGDQSFELR